VLATAACAPSSAPLAGCVTDAAARLSAPLTYWCEQQSWGTTRLVEIVPGVGALDLVDPAAAWNFDPAWSPSTRQLAFVSTREGIPELYVTDAGGFPHRVNPKPGWDAAPAWSPDGSVLLFSSGRSPMTGPLGVARRHAAIFRVRADGSGLTDLIDSPGYSADPAWSPDGTRIAFVSDRDGSLALYVAAADGSGVRWISREPGAEFRPAWSPDGSLIAFSRVPEIARPDLLESYPFNQSVSAALDHADIEAVHPDGSGARVLIDLGYQPAWSPDGGEIAFVRQRVGVPSIYTARADGSGVSALTTSGAPKFRPTWGPDVTD
jgi:TolB protein